MGERSKRVDAYVAKAPEFARPILERVREAFHAGCPDVVESIKWGVPAFEYRGMLGGMAAFKRHVGYGFWKGRLLDDPAGLFARGPRASSMGIRATSLADLPPKKVLADYVRRARRLNEQGVKEPKLARPRKSAAVAVPADLARALARNRAAREAFESFPPSARRDYVEWIEGAKREDTRARRLATTLGWLAEGKRRNWKYERC